MNEPILSTIIEPDEVNSFYDYIEAVSKTHHALLKADMDWRPGQTYFNVLWHVRPEWAMEIRNTDADPFFIDSNTAEFFTEVLRRFREEEGAEHYGHS